MSGRMSPLVLATLLGCLVGVGCQKESRSDGTSSGEAGVLDAAGIAHVFATPALRIVSLVPSATMTLYAIGAADHVVGRTDFDHQAWVADLPSVGGGLEPNLEAIVALSPDLVIRFGGAQDPRTATRLDALGIRHVAVRPDHIEDIYSTAALLGQATGRSAAADSLTAWIQAGLAEIERGVQDWPRLRVAYVLGGSPPWVAGPDSYVAEVISLLGGDNTFADLGELYAAVSPEEFRVRAIDVVLVSAHGDFDASLAPDARVVVIGGGLEIPGPGLVTAAREIAGLMHGRPLR
ncbi:MAG: helical backbone metal receptor [Gemmatimonadetes bacterium]|nr:helical backbone metal receptor [Gemmatimonadota bacterium]MDA1102554.1 helical backbone metal receptor [Gemmatimonadota bacterium]